MRYFLAILAVSGCIASCHLAFCDATKRQPSTVVQSADQSDSDEAADWGVWIDGTSHRSTVHRKTVTANQKVAAQPVKKDISKRKTHKLGEITYSEHFRGGQTEISGTINGSVIWKRSKSPYLMTDNVLVADNGKLTIEPGVVVKVARPAGSNVYRDEGVRLWVFGSLMAHGTPKEIIRFTPASNNPEKYGEWDGISFYGHEPSVLTWTIVDYARFGVECRAPCLVGHCVFRYCHTGIYLEWNFAGDILNNISEYNCYSGIRCNGTGAEARITGNIFYQNGDGIDCWNDAVAYADYNLYWSVGGGGRSPQNYRGVEPGKHDVVADPRFTDIPGSEFHLADDSPAKGAGFGGPDIGLQQDVSSPASTEDELQQWLAGGARMLWYKALYYYCYSGVNVMATYQAALDLNPEPELRAKILCSLAAQLIENKDYDKAQETANQALSISQCVATRDLARRRLSEALALQGHPDQALAMAKSTEWPQSKVWTEPAIAKYTSLLGNWKDALSSIGSLKAKEPYRYVEALSQMVKSAASSGRLDDAMALMQGFDDYSVSSEASEVRLTVAKALRDQNRFDEAVKLLKQTVDLDPFGRSTPDSLELLAPILDADLHRPDEALAVRTQLATEYFAGLPAVEQARKQLGNALPETPAAKMVLLDESQQESSIFDRSLNYSCNFGQWDVIKALSSHGLIVHSNGYVRQSTLTSDVVSRYGLIIMNGKYGATEDPAIPADVIENLASYVNNGGSLLLICGGNELGSGREAQFYNRLAARFGLSFKEDATLPDQDRMGRVADHPAVKDLTGFDAEYGVPVKGDGAILAYCGSAPVVVVKKYGRGKVMAAGLGLCFDGALLGATNKYEEETADKNKALLIRLVDYCLSK